MRIQAGFSLVTKPFRYDVFLKAIHAVLSTGEGSTHVVSSP